MEFVIRVSNFTERSYALLLFEAPEFNYVLMVFVIIDCFYFAQFLGMLEGSRDYQFGWRCSLGVRKKASRQGINL